MLAAVWNRDISSLALATEQGGIRIYELLPARTRSGNSKDVDQGHQDGNGTGTLPVMLMFRHEIVIKSTMSEGRVSTMTKRKTPSDRQKVMFGRVHCLSTEDMPRARGEGIATLVGVAEGRHLYMWDMVSGVTLLTAHAIAPTGCKVQHVAWHGPAALVALLYAVNEAPRRVDVHQLDVAGQATAQVSRNKSSGDPGLPMGRFLPGRVCAECHLPTLYTVYLMSTTVTAHRQLPLFAY